MSGGEGEPKAGEPKAGGLMTSERVGPAFEDGARGLRSETRIARSAARLQRSFSQMFTCESDEQVTRRLLPLHLSRV